MIQRMAAMLSVLLSAVVLFAVQPMVAKMLLPRLGGSPAVWGACMVFFQGALLGGYWYAHRLARLRSQGVQVVVHLLVMGAACAAALPMAVRESRAGWLIGDVPDGASGFAMAAWIVALLTVSVGPAAVVLAATSPLVQYWCARSQRIGEGSSARGPWGLYAASNIGSFAALAAYPLVIEPRWSLAEQSSGASVAIMTLVALMGILGIACQLRSRANGGMKAPLRLEADRSDDAIPLSRRAAWTVLGAVASSALVGVTTYLTTDVASVPLLWMIPLGLYLATFVLAFSRFQDRAWVRLGAQRIAAGSTVLVALAMLLGAREPLWAIVALHLTAMGSLCAACHLRVASLRPGVEQLTSFYLCLSLGGVIGGAFNALLAPLIFRSAAEYPMALVACLVCGVGWGSGALGTGWHGRQDTAPTEGMNSSCTARGGATALRPLKRVVQSWWVMPVLVLAWVLAAVAVVGPVKESGGPGYGLRLFAFGLPCLVAYLVGSRRGLVMGGCVASLLVGAAFAERSQRDVLFATRSFFGVHRVVRETDVEGREFNVLMHGTTVHGLAQVGTSVRARGSPMDQGEEGGWSRTPRGYYYPTGPIGRAIDRLARAGRLREVGLVGLGAGSLGGYADRWEKCVFYEIDPEVVRIATEPEWFRFVRAGDDRVEFRVGDARVLLEREVMRGDAGRYSLLVVDAFSSDAIPVHLLTTQAVELYMQSVVAAGMERERSAGVQVRGGVVALHISNRHMKLEPIVASIADRLGLAMVSAADFSVSDTERAEGKSESHWVFLAKSEADLEVLQVDSMFVRVCTNRGQGEATGGATLPEPWTDEFSNVLSVLDW